MFLGSGVPWRLRQEVASRRTFYPQALETPSAEFLYLVKISGLGIRIELLWTSAP